MKKLFVFASEMETDLCEGDGDYDTLEKFVVATSALGLYFALDAIACSGLRCFRVMGTKKELKKWNETMWFDDEDEFEEGLSEFD